MARVQRRLQQPTMATAAAFLIATIIAPAVATAQATPEPTLPTEGPSPAASPAPAGSGEGGFDLSKLTPAQQEAIKLAIIKISQNPVGNIAVVPFQNNFNYGVGPYTRYQYNLNIQPVVPIMLSQNWNLIARTIFPVINQPSFAPPSVCASALGCGSTFGIGDTQEQLYFAPKTKPGQFIWGVGPIFQIPTGSPQDVLGTGKWGAGIDLVGLITPGRWVMGALVTQLWPFAGKSTFPNYSNFLVQPFINYNIGHGWALTTAPSISANWIVAQNKWAVPVGGGVANTFKAGDQLMSLGVFYYSYVSRPLNQPQTQLRVQWALLWPIKRGIDIQDLIQEAK